MKKTDQRQPPSPSEPLRLTPATSYRVGCCDKPPAFPRLFTLLNMRKHDFKFHILLRLKPATAFHLNRVSSKKVSQLECEFSHRCTGKTPSRPLSGEENKSRGKRYKYVVGVPTAALTSSPSYNKNASLLLYNPTYGNL